MPPMETHHVLIAEDDPFIRRIAEVALKRAGFVVTAVADGVEALQVLEDRVPDVVLLDGMMPRMDGLDVCRRIKADPRFASVPVILVSARTEASDEAEGRSAGVAAYVRKPFDVLLLAAQIRAVCAAEASA
jgi:CheY-like chemotaxis protein